MFNQSTNAEIEAVLQQSLALLNKDSLVIPAIFIGDEPQTATRHMLTNDDGTVIPAVGPFNYEAVKDAQRNPYNVLVIPPTVGSSMVTNVEACICIPNPLDNLKVNYPHLHHQSNSTALSPCRSLIPTLCATVGTGTLLSTIDSNGNPIPICNFTVQVLSVNFRIHKGTDVGRTVSMQITGADGTHHFELSTAKLDSLGKEITQAFPALYLSDEASNASSKLTNSVREQLRHAPTTRTYSGVGWEKLEDNYLYLHDGLPQPPAHIIYDTGFIIHTAPNIDPLSACAYAFQTLDISSNLSTILLPFLFTYLGTLWTLFNEAGFPPRMLLFLHGTSGSLKTALSMVLFDIFGKGIQETASFRDSAAATEIKMGEHTDSVLFLDDYSPAVSKEHASEMNNLMEKIIRYYGDGKGRSRSTGSMEKQKEFTPRGVCAIAGEDIGGSLSSRLRCVLVEVKKGDINGNRLQKYQEDPTLWTSNIAFFLKWASLYSHTVISHIKSRMPIYRRVYEGSLKERRLVDSGAALMVTAELLLQYAASAGYCDATATQSTLSYWNEIILLAMQQSEQSSKDMDPPRMYLLALTDSLRKKQVSLAASPAEYDVRPSIYIGYEHKGELWLDMVDSYKIVKKYWLAMDKSFPLSLTKTSAALHEAGVTRTQSETRSDGTVKVNYCCRSSVKGRPRMLVLLRDALKSYLAQNS